MHTGDWSPPACCHCCASNLCTHTGTVCQHTISIPKLQQPWASIREARICELPRSPCLLSCIQEFMNTAMQCKGRCGCRAVRRGHDAVIGGPDTCADTFDACSLHLSALSSINHTVTKFNKWTPHAQPIHSLHSSPHHHTKQASQSDANAPVSLPKRGFAAGGEGMCASADPGDS